MEGLPSELWDHILSYLSLPSVLALPQFDKNDSRQVVITEGGRRARCSSVVSRFPSSEFNTAYVRTRPTTPGRPPLAVVHFLIDFEPSAHFCVSVMTPLPKPQPTDNPPAPPPPPPAGLSIHFIWSLTHEPVTNKHFIASLFDDGEIHSHGSRPPYLYVLRRLLI